MSDLATRRIIYQVSDSPVAVLIPCECGLTIEEIGVKDVPAGVPFWIVDQDLLPTDRTMRDAWSLDLEALGDPHGVGGDK